MSPAQDPLSHPDTAQLDPRVRKHLETQLAELRAKSEMLARQIAAVEADMARPYGDSIYQLILRDRQAELIAERERAAALMDSVLADTTKPPELRELHRQELMRHIEVLIEHVAALRVDEEKAATITWADRQRELEARKEQLQAERRAAASEIADREARLQEQINLIG